MKHVIPKMGRKARGTTASPIDSVMEKYHSTIGCRLSMPPDQLAVPQNISEVETQEVSEQFCMLTLDIKHYKSHRVNQDKLCQDTTKSNSAQFNIDDTKNVSQDNLESSAHNDTIDSGIVMNDISECDSAVIPPASTQSQGSSTPSSAMSQESCSVSEKDTTTNKSKGLVDKLTKALFQKKKQMCSRCRRKSRSCIPNKTFTNGEKHFTCGKCRESSHAIKNILTGSTKDNETTHDIAKSSSVQPKSRPNDSGYDTMTSCSTHASSSAFTNSTHNISANTDHSVCSHDGLTTSTENKATPIPKYRTATNLCAVCSSTHDMSTLHNSNGQQVLGVGQTGSVCVSTCLHHQHQHQHHNHHHNNNSNIYDGYLPDIVRTQSMVMPCPLPTNNDNMETQELGRELIEGYCCRYNHDMTECDTGDRASRTSSTSSKECYTCGTQEEPMFHLPWQGGWLCEECLDRMH